MSEDLDRIARAIVDGNRYMVLGTAGASGRPWVSPVYYAPSGYSAFYWVSSPEAQHSRNLAARPELSIVVFDSAPAWVTSWGGVVGRCQSRRSSARECGWVVDG
jgi:nitroimidazol reductase NimA-like FMN-containing flavoprotein (pyridoxamine 5'-phosphate oxidase superfamily)